MNPDGSSADEPTGSRASDSDNTWVGADAGPAARRTESHDKAGEQIGSYKLVSKLGEGGFGTVWLAERRQPFVQQVALKIVKLGMDSRSVVARFEQERQALALMNHPNVAKVLDGGLTPSGRPYFAMEFVKGEPITDFCDRQKLTIKQRLSLFTQVCEAVQHAHTKGIIHRDLKPGNILVASGERVEGQVKVIDFGVAKALTQRMSEHTVFTETGQMIGTPEYMSPEQAEPDANDIDTRSDVYSLGVVLYELLAGALPFDPKELRRKAYREIQRIIREEDPPAPSARLSTIATRDTELASKIATVRKQATGDLSRLLRSELEWIPLKALRKERAQRYDSPADLARDVENYLAGRPLVAAPESSGYRVRKWVRRHRGAVAAALAVFVALVVGLGLATWQWRVAEMAREAERRRADELKEVSDFQADMLGQIDMPEAGDHLMRDLEARLVVALTKDGAPDAERRARAAALRTELGRLNATDAATAMIDETILKPAVRTIDERFQDQPEVDAVLRQTLAIVYTEMGLLSEAHPLQVSALATRRRVLGEEHPRTLDSMNHMACLLQDEGRLAEAQALFERLIDATRRVLGEEDSETIGALNNMGGVLHAQGKRAEARPYFEAALTVARRALGEDSPDTIDYINNYGTVQMRDGDLAAAETSYREAHVRGSRTRGAEDARTLAALVNLGLAIQAQGRLAEAEACFRDALTKRRHAIGEEHPDTLHLAQQVAEVLRRQRKFDQAIELIAPAVVAGRKVFTEGNAHRLAAMLVVLGRTEAQQPFDPARFQRAESTLLEACRLFCEAGRGSDRRAQACMQALAELHAAWETAEPGQGHADREAEWQGKLDAATAESDNSKRVDLDG